MLCALYFVMMLDMPPGSGVSEALSRQKPWSQMTDDEKLVAVLLFMVLFTAQLIFLVPLTLILGLIWSDSPMDVVVRGPRLLLEFAPALMGVVVAALSFAWEPVRRSGQWIWLAGGLLELWDIWSRGIHNFQKFSGESPLEIVAKTPAVACVLYSLTMFLMNQWLKRSAAQSKT